MDREILQTKALTELAEEAGLIARAAQGDQDAFGELYKSHFSLLYTSLAFICKDKADAEEILQEAFLKVWHKRDQLYMIKSFKDYIYRIARNHLFDVLRRNKIHEKVMDALIAETSAEHDQPEMHLQYKQYYDSAIRAIGELSPQKKKIFLLRTQEDKSFNDIAAIMNLSTAAIKKHFYEASQKVKSAVGGHSVSLFLLVSCFLK